MQIMNNKVNDSEKLSEIKEDILLKNALAINKNDQIKDKII